MKPGLNTPIIIIYGATGTGKTEFAEQLAEKIQGSIINMDMGQLYSCLSIGTAKPDWKKSHIKQYLFDILNEKTSFTAVEYRKRVLDILNANPQEQKPIIIVGGTGFYLFNLIFSSQKIGTSSPKDAQQQISSGWNKLNEVDPKRAVLIHPNDLYRIQRALEIFYNSHVLPSECAPLFNPISSNILLLNIERNKEDLNKKIEKRVESFFNQGWVQEVKDLMSNDWTEFLLKKKFIGYPSLVEMISQGNADIVEVKKKIVQETMRYAKKQKTFWRGLYKKIKANDDKQKNIVLADVNLTFTKLDLYLNLFLKKFFPHD